MLVFLPSSSFLLLLEAVVVRFFVESIRCASHPNSLAVAITRGLVATFVGLLSLVCVPPQPVVELLLAAVAVLLGVQRRVRPGQRVHLVFHVAAVVVEVWHLPAVLLVVIVVRVGRVVRRRDAFGVGRRRAVVEVDLRAVLVGGGAEDLLGRGPPGPVGADADHPDEEDEDDDEDD